MFKHQQQQQGQQCYIDKHQLGITVTTFFQSLNTCYLHKRLLRRVMAGAAGADCPNEWSQTPHRRLLRRVGTTLSTGGPGGGHGSN